MDDPLRGDRLMRLLLWSMALVMLAFSAMHVLIAFEHWRAVGPHRESVVAPVALALISAGLALWAIRRARRPQPAA